MCEIIEEQSNKCWEIISGNIWEKTLVSKQYLEDGKTENVIEAKREIGNMDIMLTQVRGMTDSQYISDVLSPIDLPCMH